jgi:hypothetical protein
MKHLIIDFIKRWKWWLAGAVLGHFFHITAVLLESKTNFWFWILVVAAPAFLSYDLQKGAAKVHSLLPVPRGTIANSYWIQAVLLPTVVVPVGILIESYLVGTFKPSAFGSVSSIPHITLLSFAFAGTMFFILTFMPIGPQSGLWRKLLANVTGGSWGLVFAAGIFLSSDDSIHQWGTMARWQRCFLIAGVFLGIVSFFTSRLLVRSRATLRPGTHPTRERTHPRWITFPDRTQSLLGPWITTIVFSLMAFLIPAGLVLSLFAMMRGGIGEATSAILDEPGRLWIYGLTMGFVFALVAGIRSIWSLRLVRTLPVTGWGLTGLVLSFPILVWLVAWMATFVFLLATGRLEILVGLTRLILLLTGLVMLTVGLLARYGPRLIMVTLAVTFPLVMLAVFTFPGPSFLAGVSILTSPDALAGVLLSALGIWITHGAITNRSQTYRPSNFIAPGGMGR